MSAVLHQAVANRVLEYGPETVLDMGGTGKATHFLGSAIQVTDANVQQGIDCTRLPYENEAFDVAMSVAVLEHVGPADQQKRFLAESLRISRKGAVHWFPCGQGMRLAESFKRKTRGYSHACHFVDQPATGYPYHTLAEHFLLLATLHPKAFHTLRTYDFVLRYGTMYYGAIVAWVKT